MYLLHDPLQKVHGISYHFPIYWSPALRPEWAHVGLVGNLVASVDNET